MNRFRARDLMFNMQAQMPGPGQMGGFQPGPAGGLCPQFTGCWPDTDWCPGITRCHFPSDYCDWYTPVGCHLQYSHCPLYFSHCPVYISHCPVYISHCPVHISHCFGHTPICPFQTLVCPGGTIACQVGTQPCGGGSVIDPGDMLDPRVLGQLKQQLRRQLALVEAQEQALEAASGPQTVEEIDELMGKLREAMADLEARRKNMGGTQ